MMDMFYYNMVAKEKANQKGWEPFKWQKLSRQSEDTTVFKITGGVCRELKKGAHKGRLVYDRPYTSYFVNNLEAVEMYEKCKNSPVEMAELL